jgi:hypothetical protein
VGMKGEGGGGGWGEKWLKQCMHIWKHKKKKVLSNNKISFILSYYYERASIWGASLLDTITVCTWQEAIKLHNFGNSCN